MRELTRFERWCAAAFNLQYRYAERGHMKSPVHYPGGLARLAAHYHCITPACTLVAGSTAPERFAAERGELRARAERSHRERPVQAVVVFIGVCAAAGVAFMVYAIATLVRDGQTAVGDVIGGSLWFLAATWMFFQLMVSIGRHFYMVDAMQQWAKRLGGASGFDTVEPVVAWVNRFWSWFVPPHFLSTGTMWATGWQSGRSVLLVSEREETWIIASGVKLLSASGDEDRGDVALEVPKAMLCRLSLFIAGGMLGRDPGAVSVVQELGSWGYGVVTTPAGVYLYGLAYERGLNPSYLSAVVDKVFSALEHGTGSQGVLGESS